MRQIKRIFVHCTASPQSWGVAELQEVFDQKGWKNPGYHVVILADGTWEQMLSLAKVANGVQGYNSTAIHVAYVGGIDDAGKPTDNRTDAQKEELRHTLTVLHEMYPDAEILGHRDIWGVSKRKKECPCFDAKIEYKDIIGG